MAAEDSVPVVTVPALSCVQAHRDRHSANIRRKEIVRFIVNLLFEYSFCGCGERWNRTGTIKL